MGRKDKDSKSSSAKAAAQDKATPEGQEPDGRRWVKPALLYGLPWTIAIGVMIAVVVVRTGDDGSSVSAAAKKPDTQICQPIKTDSKGVSAFDPDACPPLGSKAYEGLIAEVTDTSIVLVEADKKGILGDRVTLNVRKKDSEFLDLPHWRDHSQLATPVAIFTNEYKGEEIIVYIEDSAIKIDFDAIDGAPLAPRPKDQPDPR